MANIHPPAHLPTPDGRATFDRILNFRDLGQHINHLTSQPLLNPGLFYRSARPDAATSSDRVSLVREHRIRIIIDLRTPTEQIEQAGSKPADIPSTPAVITKDAEKGTHRSWSRIEEIQYKDINFNGHGYSSALIKQLTYGQTAKLFGLYAFGFRKPAISVLGTNVMAARGLDGLAEDSLAHSRQEVRSVFSVLCDAASYPVMVHCTQGKDRTGLVVLLVLMLCGVPREAIVRDYRLSEKELEPEREEKLVELRSIGLPDAFADCPEKWVDYVCEYTEKTFGGVEKYLEGCGVTAEQRKALKDLLKMR